MGRPLALRLMLGNGRRARRCEVAPHRDRRGPTEPDAAHALLPSSTSKLAERRPRSISRFKASCGHLEKNASLWWTWISRSLSLDLASDRKRRPRRNACCGRTYDTVNTHAVTDALVSGRPGPAEAPWACASLSIVACFPLNSTAPRPRGTWNHSEARIPSNPNLPLLQKALKTKVF